jgi:hypothetical protein
MSFSVGNRAPAPLPEARWRESGGASVSLRAFPDETPDATYEISTDEYLSVVRFAILGRTGSRRYRPEALSAPCIGTASGHEQSKGQNDQED